MKNNSMTSDVDVFYLVKKIWIQKFKILFLAVIFGLLALFASLFLMTPEYQSVTKVYVVNQSTDNQKISTQDLQAGDYLVKDYKEIILSKDVMTNVIEKEGLELSVEELTGKVTVDIPVNTRIISIAVTDENPEKASFLANKVREISAETIKEITKVEDVTVFEEAVPADEPVSPNIKRNVLLGMIFGGFVAVIAVLLKEVLDDRVRRAEDVEEVLHMTLLGVVPDINKMK